MSEVKGHAAFHKHKDAPRHTGTRVGTRGERRKLLKESMRHLDPKEVARQSHKNGSIAPADAHLNTAYVNDGNNGFEVATSIKQVLDYGDAREKRVHRKIAAGSRTVDLFVVHLPKTMCVEIKDYYPRYNPDGSERLDPETGEPMSRSRWVARDHDEAMRYFVTAVAFLGLKVSPGGMDSIHGWATNFDESTPHIQVMADPFAPDPKVPGALRTEASRAYTSHAEVRKANGKMYGKGERIREYQAQLRERMIAEGYPVESEPGEHHGRELPKEVYEEVQDEKAEAASLRNAATRGEARNARDRRELDRDRAIVASIREDVIAARKEVSDDLALVARTKARNAADAAQNAADRAELREVAIDDAEALSWHRSDADADILAARAAADEELAEAHYVAGLRERIASARIKWAADFAQQVGDLGNKALEKIDDEVKRQPLRESLDAALTPPTPVPAPQAENRHAAAAKRDRDQKDAARAALIDGGTQQQTGSRTGIPYNE